MPRTANAGTRNTTKRNVTRPASPATQLRRLVAELKKVLKMREQAGHELSNVDRRRVNAEIQSMKRKIYDLCYLRPLPTLPNPSGWMIYWDRLVQIPAPRRNRQNFIGRIIGPRGITISRLEHLNGVSITLLIFDRGWYRLPSLPYQPAIRNRRVTYFAHIQCIDVENRAKFRVNHAAAEIKKLLVPIPEHMDYFKQIQLMELAMFNRNYRVTENSLMAEELFRSKYYSTH